MTFNPSHLKLMRLQAGLSQRELAKSSGVSKSHISDIERTLRTPSDETVAKLAAALDTSVAGFYLYGEKAI